MAVTGGIFLPGGGDSPIIRGATLYSPIFTSDPSQPERSFSGRVSFWLNQKEPVLGTESQNFTFFAALISLHEYEPARNPYLQEWSAGSLPREWTKFTIDFCVGPAWQAGLLGFGLAGFDDKIRGVTIDEVEAIQLNGKIKKSK